MTSKDPTTPETNDFIPDGEEAESIDFLVKRGYLVTRNTDIRSDHVAALEARVLELEDRVKNRNGTIEQLYLTTNDAVVENTALRAKLQAADKMAEALEGHIELYSCDGDYPESTGETIQRKAKQALAAYRSKGEG